MKGFLIVLLAVASVTARDPRCPVENAVYLYSPVHLQHDLDCHKFYKCHVNGELEEENCMPGLEFNPKHGVCDWPKGYCDYQQQQNNIKCRERIAGKKYKGDNCNSYYICENGQVHTYYCEYGYLYNAITQTCDWASNVQCDTAMIESPVFAAVPPCTSDQNWEYFVDPYNCQDYYRCENNEAKHYKCDQGLLFDPILKVCNWGASVQCTSVPVPLPPIILPPTGCPPDEDGQHPTHLAHLTDCTKFYKCLEGYPVLQDCPAGMHWNIEKDYCDYPENANCNRN